MWIKLFLVAAACVFGAAADLEVQLEPVSYEELGDWARVAQPLRLRAEEPSGVQYEGPTLEGKLWGQLSLGKATYAMLLGFTEEGEVGLWLSDEGQLTDEDKLSGAHSAEAQYVRWEVELDSITADGEAFPYQLNIVWPEGRGYVFLEGGQPRRGTLQLDGEQYEVVLVDGEITGTYGTDRDFYAVDWTRDGVLHAEPGAHERFGMDEPLTIAERSFLVEEVEEDGTWMSFVLTEYAPPKTPLVPGYEAPGFTFEPFPDGPEISLSDLRGKVVLLDFWATWCVPCMDELPRLRQIYRAFAEEDFEIIGISLDTSGQTLRRVLDEQEVEWPQYFDGGGWETEIAELYRIEATPHLILLDQDGVIQEVNPSLDELPFLIEELLGVSVWDDAPDASAVAAEDVPERVPEESSRRGFIGPVLIAVGIGLAILLLVTGTD